MLCSSEHASTLTTIHKEQDDSDKIAQLDTLLLFSPEFQKE